MNATRLWRRSPLLVAGVGATLLLAAVVHHASELLALNGLVGPLAALALDGPPAAALVYAGYRLAGSDLDPRSRWRVCLWCMAGVVLFAGAIGATFLVRAYEGRVVAEAAFPLLVAAEAGGIAGLVAGYYNTRARADARQAETVTDALSFVNSLIRHDLRNDLNVIRGRAELAAEAEPDHAPVVVEKADEALTRIETTRAIAETLAGDAEFEPVDLVPVVAELAASVEEAFDATVSTDLPERARVTANAGVRSVVDNLLENAAEHNDAEEPRIEVEVTAGAGTVQLVVRDNGPGIPDAERDELFDGGEGGGLSLIGTLVEGYGGDVWVEDNEPRGSTFVVVLPRADGRE